MLLLMRTMMFMVVMIRDSCTGFELRDENEVGGKIGAQLPQLDLQQPLNILPRKATILPQKLE